MNTDLFMESNFVIFYFDTVLHTLYHGIGISILKSVIELRLILQHCDLNSLHRGVYLRRDALGLSSNLFCHKYQCIGIRK